MTKHEERKEMRVRVRVSMRSIVICVRKNVSSVYSVRGT
jgi:hypothetical protein